jgi:hypothetical protein
MFGSSQLHWTGHPTHVCQHKHQSCCKPRQRFLFCLFSSPLNQRWLRSAVMSRSRNTFPESSTEARCPSNTAHFREANRTEAAATD